MASKHSHSSSADEQIAAASRLSVRYLCHLPLLLSPRPKGRLPVSLSTPLDSCGRKSARAEGEQCTAGIYTREDGIKLAYPAEQRRTRAFDQNYSRTAHVSATDLSTRSLADAVMQLLMPELYYSAPYLI